jgi:hypothetical protein
MSQTFGQKAVGLSFNPSGNDSVQAIKVAFANAIDILNDARTASLASQDTHEANEVRRMLSIAITEAQTAQMWAVNAVTWKA